MRIMPESSGWARTVLPCTKWSYCWVIHCLDAWLGEATSFRTWSFSSSDVCGRGSLFASSAWSSSCQDGRAYGRS
ncbi:hypothetical protein STENM223S_01210 [Streptomyces tendae]